MADCSPKNRENKAHKTNFILTLSFGRECASVKYRLWVSVVDAIASHYNFVVEQPLVSNLISMICT